jgi:hypothetical protein
MNDAFDNPVTLRFSARISGGLAIPEAAFLALRLPNGTSVTLTLEADRIQEDATRRGLLARSNTTILPKGALVIGTVTDSANLAPPDRAYVKFITSNAPGVPNYRHWKNLIPVEIILLEDLELSARVHGGRRLCSCRCHIPYLDTEARSLNHALSLVSRRFEPGRVSSSVNSFKQIYVQDEGKHWCRLEELRAVWGAK